MNDFTGAFKFMGERTDVLWTSTKDHLLVSLIAVVVALAIALPVGVWLGHLKRFSFLAINLSNLGRALPSVAVLALLLPLTGVTRTTVIIALIVLAVPPVLTNAYVAVSEVDKDAVEAAVGMGMKPMQVLTQVELPMALPLMFAGIRTAAVYVVATATLGGFFGGGGLGDIISNPASYRFTGVLAASIWVAVLALLADFGFGGLQRLLTPRGLKDRAPAALVPAAASS